MILCRFMDEKAYPTLKGLRLVEVKTLIGDHEYELLRYVDSSRTQMLLLLHVKGSRGGAYFGGDMHAELMKTPGHVSGFWNTIQSADDFKRFSDHERDQMRDILQSVEPKR